MKFKAIKYTAVMAAVAAGLSSCSGFLDTPTDTRVDLVNTDQVRMLMNSAYPQVSYAWPMELMSDNMEDNNAPEGPGNQGIHYNLNSYDRGDEEMFRWEQCVSSTGADSPSMIWEDMYGSIAVCNAVLERLDQWEKENGKLDATQRAIYGEALMLRSYCHFILAQVFCEPYRGSLNANYPGIPYATKPEITVKPHYERGTLDRTYEKIEEDLERAMPMIDNSLYAVPKYHFNTAAAHAYAARFYLFTRRYQKAFDHANLAFGGADVDASAFMSDIWTKLGEIYMISDMGLYQNGADKATNFLLYPTHTQLLRRLGSSCRYGVIRDALNSTIYGASPAWANFQWKYNSGKGGTFTMHPCYNGICINNGSQTEYGTVACCNVDEQFEYIDKIAGVGYTRQTRREFFGEETLLTRAEARLFLGDEVGALADIDIWEKARRRCPSAAGYESEFRDFTLENIREFYGGDPGYGICKTINIDRICPESDAKVSADAVMPMLQCIQHLRRIETIHKGMRWFDIKRFGLEYDRKIGNNQGPDYHTVDHLDVEDPRKAVQIPAEVVAAGMQPNPRASRVPDTTLPSESYVRVH